MRKLQERVERIEIDSKGMASSYAVEREKMEVRVKKMEEAKEERERVEVEHTRQLVDLDRRLQDTTSASAADRVGLEQVMREERQRMEVRLVDLARRLQDETDASATRRASLEQETREEREGAEAELKQQLEYLKRHLRDTTDVPATYQAKWEQIGQQQAALREGDEAMKQKLEERTRELQGQMKEIKNGTEGLEARVKEMEQGAKKERERAQAEYRQQLVDLAGRLQGENKVCLVHRMRLEQEIQELQNRVTTTIAMPPRPTSYVQVLCLATYDD